MNNIRRKIMFFKLGLTVYNKASNTSEIPANISQVFENSLKRVNALSFEDEENSRYYKNSDDNLLYIDIDEFNNDVIKGKFVLSRKKNFPDIENKGELSALYEKLPADSGLAEISHFIYFKNKNILGYEFNFFAPRATALNYYIPYKDKDNIMTVDVNQILNMDADRKIDETEEISLLDIAVHKNQLGLIRQMDQSLSDALEAASRLSNDAETIEVIIRRKKYSKKSFLWPSMLDKLKLKRFLGDQDKRCALEKLVIKSETLGKAIDLLEDKMIVEETMVLHDDKQKRVVSSSAFEAITKAYDQCFT